MVNQDTDIVALMDIATLVHDTEYKTKQSFGESDPQRLKEGEHFCIEWLINQKIKDAIRAENKKGLDSMVMESIFQTAKDMGLEFDADKLPCVK
jgi:hypothetical protein